MKKRDILRWLGVVVAIPLGGGIGYLTAFFLCFGILHLQGKGSSHNDMFTLVAAGLLGSLAGALLLPFCAWFFTRARRID